MIFISLGKINSTMKKLNLLLLVFILISLNGTSQEVYLSPDGIYSFIIPSEWEKIPKKIIDDQTELSNERFGLNIEYETGFCPKSTEFYFDYPYLLIQILEMEGLYRTPFKEIVKKMSKESTNPLQKEIVNNIEEILKIQNTPNGYIDESRHIIFDLMTLDVEGIGEVIVISGVFIGKNQMVNVNCYTRSENFDTDLISFVETLESFKYFEGSEYKYSGNSRVNKDFWAKVVAGVIIMIVILLFKQLTKTKNAN